MDEEERRPRPRIAEVHRDAIDLNPPVVPLVEGGHFGCFFYADGILQRCELAIVPAYGVRSREKGEEAWVLNHAARRQVAENCTFLTSRAEGLIASAGGLSFM